MSSTANTGIEETFLASIERIGDDVAAKWVDEVDRDARFPHEAIDALRESHALSALVPRELGGGGASIDEIASACFKLGRAAAPARWSSPCTRSRSLASSGTGTAAMVRGSTCATLVTRPAADRLRDLRGRDRRRHGRVRSLPSRSRTTGPARSRSRRRP